ncbi:hypothetical protein EGH22_18135 [Halomicroarcula sp. F28]|uniref:hypothetical protein n=1 Tax=Haloarcula salinisoli TaxID=2487746 RepID=UPI001C72D74B|nr:hypothetical protein [Halomicroarcula salinisoli]MBX0288253.1 hypothetical protein [Halomicroarcula salinisoli]
MTSDDGNTPGRHSVNRREMLASVATGAVVLATGATSEPFQSGTYGVGYYGFGDYGGQ